MSRRFKITIEYDGTNFYGWQKQVDMKSVQGTIEDAIYSFSNQKTLVYGSGRTDAGVHATGQVAHFDLDTDLEAFQIFCAINHFTKTDLISILEIEEVPESFHARFDATIREYEYLIINRSSPPALYINKAWHCKTPLDIEKMKDATSVLIGKHDFTSFRSVKCQSKNPVKTINDIQINKDGELIKIKISAPSFLQNQVRIIVGTLSEVGNGKITKDDVQTALDARDRTKAPFTAPSCGLYLAKVTYN